MDSRITPDMARRELARRELERRQSLNQQEAPQNADSSMNEEQVKKLLGIGSTPFGNIRDVLSGVADTGQNIANALTGNRATHYDFGSENTNPLLRSLGQYLPAAVAGGPSVIGQAIGGGLTGFFNTKPDEENAFGFLPQGRIGGAIENALIPPALKGISKALPALANIPRTIKSALSDIKPKDAAKAVQNAHDAIKSEASRLFYHVEEEATNRGISKIPISNDLIDAIAKKFPKTEANQALLDKARKGDYSDLRKLQTDLWNRGQKNKISKFEADRMKGEVQLDLRNKLNREIENHFKDLGHKDLVSLLKAGTNKWKNLQETYYEHPAISKLVHEKIRKTPKNILNVLTEDSVPMERVRQSNPLISENINKVLEKQNALKKLKYLGGIGVVGAGTPYAVHEAKNIFGS